MVKIFIFIFIKNFILSKIRRRKSKFFDDVICSMEFGKYGGSNNNNNNNSINEYIHTLFFLFNQVCAGEVFKITLIS